MSIPFTDSDILGKYHEPVRSNRMSMSELDLQMQAVREIMSEPNEPQTPAEHAQHNVEMATRDAWLATAELFKLRCDPVAAPFFSEKIEADLWSIKMRVDILIDELRAEHGERPLPKLKVVSNG